MLWTFLPRLSGAFWAEAMGMLGLHHMPSVLVVSVYVRCLYSTTFDAREHDPCYERQSD